MKVSGPAYLWYNAVSREAVVPFSDAWQAVRDELSAGAASGPSRDIFTAHLEILEDPVLRDTVEGNMAAGMEPLKAVESAMEGICAFFNGIDDEYLKARVDDVRDVFQRIINKMCGGTAERRKVPAGSIIVAEELLPSDTVKIDFGQVRGILCHKGSSTSHVCIIAHSKGVPIQLGADISNVSEGDIVEVDDPLAGENSIAFEVRAAGRKVYANAGSLDAIAAAIAAGADGIGLFRTEFLFLGRSEAPSEGEQRELYSKALELCAGMPLTLRLLDIGGDKAIPYLPSVEEDNPFLGLRGVRYGLAHPGLYESQLLAAAEAALKYPGQLRLMIPMVCSADEIRAVRAMLPPLPAGTLQLGIMIETPAAVLNAAALASECDFFSIGTNDLTQYIMAADRGNPAVAYVYDPLSPAVQAAMAMTVKAAHAAGIPVGICGELASDPDACRPLLDLGLDSLSLSRLS